MPTLWKCSAPLQSTRRQKCHAAAAHNQSTHGRLARFLPKQWRANIERREMEFIASEVVYAACALLQGAHLIKVHVYGLPAFTCGGCLWGCGCLDNFAALTVIWDYAPTPTNLSSVLHKTLPFIFYETNCKATLGLTRHLTINTVHLTDSGVPFALCVLQIFCNSEPTAGRLAALSIVRLVLTLLRFCTVNFILFGVAHLELPAALPTSSVRAFPNIWKCTYPPSVTWSLP